MGTMLKNFDLFIFDWDGTLSTSTALVRFTSLFKRRYDPEYIKRHEQLYRNVSMEDVRITEEEHNIFSSIYGLYSMFTKPRLRDSAIPLMSYLKKKRKKVAIFSDGKFYRLLAETRSLGALKYTDFMLTASVIKRYKPDPTGLLLISDKLGVSRKRCIYFGDMASDIMAAKFAGMHSAGIRGGLHDIMKLKAAEPEYMFNNLHEVLAKLK